jgi:hypothetical protein
MQSTYSLSPGLTRTRTLGANWTWLAVDSVPWLHIISARKGAKARCDQIVGQQFCSQYNQNNARGRCLELLLEAFCGAFVVKSPRWFLFPSRNS